MMRSLRLLAFTMLFASAAHAQAPTPFFATFHQIYAPTNLVTPITPTIFTMSAFAPTPGAAGSVTVGPTVAPGPLILTGNQIGTTGLVVGGQTYDVYIYSATYTDPTGTAFPVIYTLAIGQPPFAAGLLPSWGQVATAGGIVLAFTY
ncbi:MAG: hypothetical protein AB8H79_15270 [Myxococcota bacterium]